MAADDNNANGDDNTAKNNQEPDNKETQEPENKGNGAPDNKGSNTVPHEKFHEERERRKEAEAELEAFRKKEQEAKEKEMAKNGEYEKLLGEKNQEIEKLKAELSETSESLKAFEDNADKRVQDTLQSVEDEETRDFLQGVLNKYPVSERESVLPQLLKTAGAGDKMNKNASANVNGENSQKAGSKGSDIAELEKQISEARKNRNSAKVLELESKLHRARQGSK